jgi:hypothetical protein
MSLPILKFNVDDIKTLKFQLREADKTTPVDITGLTFTFYARDEAGSPIYTIDPVTATITDAANGRFEFDVTMPSTGFDGFYWIERTDGGETDTFQPAEGTQIQVLEK